MVCVVGRMRDLILQLSKSSIYSTKPLEGLKCMFSDNSLSVNRVLFSRITEIAFSNSDVVIVESELKTCDAGRLKHLHISPVNIIFLLKPRSGMRGQIAGNDSNLLIVFYVQIMPDDFVMQLHRF
jgi:hypothetical protein